MSASPPQDPEEESTECGQEEGTPIFSKIRVLQSPCAHLMFNVAWMDNISFDNTTTDFNLIDEFNKHHVMLRPLDWKKWKKKEVDHNGVYNPDEAERRKGPGDTIYTTCLI